MRLHASFKDRILAPGFPCVAARSVFNRTTYRMSLCGELGSAESARAICHDLYEFAHEFLRPGIDQRPGRFVSFIAAFRTTAIHCEADFERLLWRQLQAMHDIDVQHFDWDPTVNKHPEHAAFSFSIGGHAYFVVGLNPCASRRARFADHACIVFNPHAQFEQLRAQGKFVLLQHAIRERDLAFQGSVNPMLSDHGEASESHQYSGRAVPSHWRCPFHHQDLS